VWRAHARHSAIQGCGAFWQHALVPRFSTLTAVLALALPTTALADSATTSPVVGGHDAVPGVWPDVAGIMFDNGGELVMECTGTLIAPTLVITAGHCNFDTMKAVWVGSVSRSQLGDGEQIEVVERFEYPDSQNSIDVTVVRLARASAKPPRTIATGWARFDIVDGADIRLVGFGAVNESGSEYIDPLQEASSTITDADCSTTALGCNPAARPDGELGAGGDGIDTCFGDSGGPLYLLTDHGTFLAGVTSRGYDTATRPCADGGIYGRPDAIVEWIEETTDVTLPRGPEPSADVLVAPGGNGAVTIEPNDPRPGTATSSRS